MFRIRLFQQGFDVVFQCISTLDVGNLIIAKPTDQVAQNFVGKQFRDGTANGTLTLAFGHINSVRPQPVKTVVESMIEQNLLQEHLFIITIDRECFVSFGFIDELIRVGRDIHLADIDNQSGLWKFSSCMASVG
jgi:hypothetical protein